MLSVLRHQQGIRLSSLCSFAIVNKPQPLHYKMDPKLPDQPNTICELIKTLRFFNTLKCCYLLFSRKPTPHLPSSLLLVNITFCTTIPISWGHSLFRCILDISHQYYLPENKKTVWACSSRNSTATPT